MKEGQQIVQTSDTRIAYDHWHHDRAIEDDLGADLKNPWNSFICGNLPALSGKVVLEIACGRGQLTSFLSGKGGKVIGADISPAALTIAKSRAGHNVNASTFINADAGLIPLRDQSVDVIISCETIEHTPDPVAVMKEFHRVLKPNGRLLLTFPNCLNMVGMYRIYLWALGRPYDSGASIQPIEQVLIAPLVLAKLRNIGFSVLKTDASIHNLLIPGLAPIRLSSIDRTPPLRRLLKPLGIHFSVIATR